jgi:hypothetical protein
MTPDEGAPRRGLLEAGGAGRRDPIGRRAVVSTTGSNFCSCKEAAALASTKEHTVSNKSPRQSATKKVAAKSIKEKRADKKAKAADSAASEIISVTKKR